MTFTVLAKFSKWLFVLNILAYSKFYSVEAHHANYSKNSLNHHFQHCAHCVDEIYNIFEVFEIAVCFAHFVVFEIWTPLAMVNVVQIIISNIAHTVYIRFTVFLNVTDSQNASYGERCSNHHFRHCAQLQLQTFRNCCLFCTFWLIRNFYSGHEQHVNYGKHSLNDHYQHCAHCAYDIYSIFKVFEMAVCFAHFGLFEISTPLRRIMLTIANIV